MQSQAAAGQTAPIVRVVGDASAHAEATAARVVSVVQRACARRGSAAVCFTGGHTARDVYERLADGQSRRRHQIEWAAVHAFWGDERHVSTDDPASNAGMTQRALLAHVPIPDEHVHPLRGDLLDAEAAAREYERILPSTFDLMLLGLGADAHIASLFPGSALLDGGTNAHEIENRRVRAVWVQDLSAWRLTLTPAEVLNARTIIVLAAGAEKARAVQCALEAPTDITRWPAQLLRAAGDRVEWVLDTAAAGLLTARRG
jgi:6-phosphogluconolactonase